MKVYKKSRLKFIGFFGDGIIVKHFRTVCSLFTTKAHDEVIESF